MSDTLSKSFSLRDLPFPAKLVVTVFLFSVGLGYLWGMAQIHFKHSSGGEPMPSVGDLVQHFSGVPWPTVPKVEEKPEEKKEEKPEEKKEVAKAPVGEKVPGAKIKSIFVDRCVVCHSKDGEKDDVLFEKYEQLEKYLKVTSDYPKGHLHAATTGSRTAWNKKNMAKAFFEKSEDWSKIKAEEKEKVTAQRVAEQTALAEWLAAGAPKDAYDSDEFAIDPKVIDAITPTYQTKAPARNNMAPAKDLSKAKDPWKDAKSKQLSVEQLTQSTHAHLLSFSMLWALTGFVFACTSYSKAIRCLIAPVVLIAQVADISCWWLARLDGIGPYFAMAILATGAVVGGGLVLQIFLSLFNMYGGKGRSVIALLILIGMIGFGVVGIKVVKPQLDREKAAAATE